MSRRDGTKVPNSAQSILADVENYSSISISICQNIVDNATKELDDEMSYIRQSLVDKSLDDELLSTYILELANILYFVGERMEIVGIQEDTCKSIRAVLYNKARDTSTGTKADKDTVAELAVKNETVVSMIFGRAYKMIKLKYESGYEMLNSLKKIMNKRISETELSNSKFIGGTRNGNN